MKNISKPVRALAAALITFGTLADRANAAAIIIFTESGGNVIATASGSLLQPSAVEASFGSASAGLSAGLSSNFVAVGSTNLASVSLGTSVVGSFSGPASPVSATSSTGPRIGANASAGRLLYGSETPWDTPLTSTAIFNSTTLLALNLSPSDNFTLTYPAIGGGSDTLTVQVVPEPSSLLLIGFGALSLAIRRR